MPGTNQTAQLLQVIGAWTNVLSALISATGQTLSYYNQFIQTLPEQQTPLLPQPEDKQPPQMPGTQRPLLPLQEDIQPEDWVDG